jgi:hypothetical protein
VQVRPTLSEYGGARTSRTAQEATEVKQCRFPPLWGYKTEVGHDDVRTPSICNLANLAAYQEQKKKLSVIKDLNFEDHEGIVTSILKQISLTLVNGTVDLTHVKSLFAEIRPQFYTKILNTCIE